MVKKILQEIIERGEGQNLEFKETTSNPEQILAEVSAFANSEGGTILVGVKDSGKAIGVKDPEGELEYLKGKIETGLKPVPSFSITSIEKSKDRAILEIQIHESTTKPIGVMTGQSKFPMVFIRVGDESIKVGPVKKKSFELSNKAHKGKLKYGSLEHKILSSLDTNPVKLKELQKTTHVARPILIRKLALLASRDLLKIELREGKELFSVSSGIPDYENH